MAAMAQITGLSSLGQAGRRRSPLGVLVREVTSTR
jgi:hypothetical protein